MISLIVLVAVTLLSRALGLVWAGSDTWLEAVRLGLAAMFIVTGLSHFSPRMRPDFVCMVPPMFLAPAALVTLTGVLELLGTIGLLLPPSRTSRWAADTRHPWGFAFRFRPPISL